MGPILTGPLSPVVIVPVLAGCAIQPTLYRWEELATRIRTDNAFVKHSSENSAKSEAIRIDGNQTDNYVIKDLPADIYHISMVTIDSKDVPSELSEIVSVDLR